MKRVTILISLVSLLPLIFVGSIRAGESELPQSITVSSVYWDPMVRSWGNVVEWLFSSEGFSQGEHGRALHVTRKGASSPTALLRYGVNGRLRKVIRFLSAHGRTRRIVESFSGPVALSDGFPVPFDYLAPEDPELLKAKVRERAGGRIFSQQVQKTVREVTFDWALREGLIKDEVKELVGVRPLRMIEIIKGDTVIVRQLWATGLAWWVYEEGEFRKSWLVKLSMQNEQLIMSNEN